MQEIFYDIPFSSENAITKSGTVLHKPTSVFYNKFENDGIFKVCLKEGNKFRQEIVARILAIIFLPIVEGKNFVGFKDNNSKNIDIENLEWLSQKEIQDRAFIFRCLSVVEKFSIPTYFSETGFYYGNSIPCIMKPGYFYIPGIKSPVVINNKGELYDLENNTVQTTYLNRKGYVTVSLLDNNFKRRTFMLHRLVASLFVDKSKNNPDLKANDLQVNHKDGIKINNEYSNLEWVTGFENMNHGRDNGLFTNQKSVTCKNLLTDNVLNFRSVSLCADFFGISIASLFYHLDSKEAGYLPIKGNLIKYTDNKDWPNTSSYDYMLDDAITYSGAFVALNNLKGKQIIFSSLKSAIEKLNINNVILRNTRQRLGKDVPVDGWIFKPLSDFIHSTRIY